MGLGGRFGSGEQIFSWIHISDVINAFEYMIHNKKCKGAYNFVALSQVTNKELIDNISCILKTKLILHMPEYLVKILFGKMGEDLLLKGNKIIPDKLIKDGYKFKYDSIKNALNDIYNKI